MSHRRYETAELVVDVRGLGSAHGVRLNVEHTSGAALMIPRATEEVIDGGVRVRTSGFDGTHYTVDVFEQSVTIDATAASPILGGAQHIEAPRVEVPAADPGALRVTGDEETMPIPMAKE